MQDERDKHGSGTEAVRGRYSSVGIGELGFERGRRFHAHGKCQARAAEADGEPRRNALCSEQGFVIFEQDRRAIGALFFF